MIRLRLQSMHLRLPTAILFLSFVFHAAAADETAARPNVLFIAVDDLRPNLGCYGDEVAVSRISMRWQRAARPFCGRIVSSRYATRREHRS